MGTEQQRLASPQPPSLPQPGQHSPWMGGTGKRLEAIRCVYAFFSRAEPNCDVLGWVSPSGRNM